MSSVQLLVNPNNGMSPIAKIFLSWVNICNRFIEKFDEQFHGKRKAHFDTLPSSMRTVDGARGKWSQLILLDAIIYLLNEHHPTTTIRRYFNQHRVLCESITAELRAASTSYHELSEVDFDNLCGDISVVFLPIHWVSLASFREYHLNNAPTKARTKFLSVLDTLTTHPCIRDCLSDLPYVLKKVVLKVISDHSDLGFTGIASHMPMRAAEPALHCPSPVYPRSPSRRSMSIDSGIEPNNMFLTTRSNSAFSSSTLPFPGFVNTQSASGQIMTTRLSSTQQQQEQSNPLPRQYPSTPMNQQPVQPSFSYGDHENRRVSPFIMQQLPPTLQNAVFGVKMEKATSTESSGSVGKIGKTSPLLTAKDFFPDFLQRSFDTVGPENEVLQYRPSCSTIDESESLATNMMGINTIANSDSRNSLMLLPQSTNMLPLDMDLLMDLDESATPKDTYDWADFVEDFSRDDAEFGDNMDIGDEHVSRLNYVALPVMPQYQVKLEKDAEKTVSALGAAVPTSKCFDNNRKRKVSGDMYMDAESPSSFTPFRLVN